MPEPSISVKPFSVWPRAETESRTRSQFSATFTDSLELLKVEIDNLDGREIVIHINVRPKDIRNDGWIRADAIPLHPGVLVEFRSRHGQLVYGCDRFLHWHNNLRAIALTLERLRLSELYGAAQGQQYTGFKALPMLASAVEAFSTREQAASWMLRQVLANGVAITDQQLLDFVNSPDQIKRIYRMLIKDYHPDSNTGGNKEKYQQLNQAHQLLGGS